MPVSGLIQPIFPPACTSARRRALPSAPLEPPLVAAKSRSSTSQPALSSSIHSLSKGGPL